MDTTPGAVPLGTRRTAAEPVILMTTRESVAVWTAEEYGRYLAVSSAYSRWLHPGPVAFDLALPGETTLRAFGVSTSAPLGHGQAGGQRFERVRSTLRPLKAPWEDQVPEAFTMEHWVYDLDQPPVDRDEPWRWTNGQLEIDLQLPAAITRPAGA
ncbi:hypothetical protein ACFY4B_27525 [Kitasatospora sp. NPDC001261]|uniref:hypothetical protein n=1 Tax=Kitasatospora sp. NPDC001261 TaxID=3364012 RepID=UPI0036865A90